MHAAVVHAFDRPPHYEEVATPEPEPGEILVEVLAAGLHPRVRSSADNSHYTSGGTLPMIPGIDGVGCRADGRLVFFVAGDSAPWGTMADYTVVDERRSVELPDGLDPLVVAAGMNPAMSSWGRAAAPGRLPTRSAGARPGRDRQRRSAGGPGGETASARAEVWPPGLGIASGWRACHPARCGRPTVPLHGPADEVDRALVAAAEVDACSTTCGDLLLAGAGRGAHPGLPPQPSPVLDPDRGGGRGRRRRLLPAPAFVQPSPRSEVGRAWSRRRVRDQFRPCWPSWARVVCTWGPGRPLAEVEVGLGHARLGQRTAPTPGG